MKPNAVTCLLLIFCVMNLFFGCSQRKAVPLPELEQAEAVMFDHPDSALRILESMPMPTDKEQHALWCLLVTQARYKQYLPIPSDSLIRIAYDYYKPTDDARRKTMAALYMGEINYDLRKSEDAFVFYTEAVSNVQSVTDYRLGYLVMVGVGNVYLFRGLTNEAFEACQKAYDYALQASYKRYEMGALNLLARCYISKKDFDNAILYYKRAIELADSLGLVGFSYSAKGELASVYSVLGQYNKSLSLEKEVLCNDNPSLPQVYYAMGLNYKKLNQLDSAYYYLIEALKTSNIYTRSAVYNVLYELSAKPPFQKYSRMYSDSMLFYMDSIYEIDKSKEIIAYKEKYENEKLITQNQQLELEKAYTFRLLLLLVIVILVLVYFYQRRKVAIHEKEEELNRLGLRLHEHESLMDRNNAYIAELEAQIAEGREASDQLGEQEETLASLRKENDSLRRDADRLRKEMEKLRLPSEEAGGTERIAAELRQTRQENEELRIRMLERYPELSSLHAHPVYLQAEGMSRLRQICDTVYGGFCRRLSQSVPSLSEYEVELCCLIKLRFTVGEIAALLGISPSSVSTSKHRVKKKIYSCLGITDKKSLDLWVWEA